MTVVYVSQLVTSSWSIIGQPIIGQPIIGQPIIGQPIMRASEYSLVFNSVRNVSVVRVINVVQFMLSQIPSYSYLCVVVSRRRRLCNQQSLSVIELSSFSFQQNLSRCLSKTSTTWWTNCRQRLTFALPF